MKDVPGNGSCLAEVIALALKCKNIPNRDERAVAFIYSFYQSGANEDVPTSRQRVADILSAYFESKLENNNNDGFPNSFWETLIAVNYWKYKYIRVY